MRSKQMREQMYSRITTLEQQLAAAQTEAREADMKLAALEHKHAALQSSYDAQTQRIVELVTEASLLRKKLGRARKELEYLESKWRNCEFTQGTIRRTTQECGVRLQPILAALAQPATGKESLQVQGVADGTDTNVGTIPAAGRDPAELVRLFNSNDWPRPGAEQPAERESLPLLDDEWHDEYDSRSEAAAARVEADWDLARELGKERNDG